MTIVCGTDFSAPAEKACTVAASLAQHHREPLVLVHALAPLAVAPPDAAVPARLYDDLAASAWNALTDLARRLGRSGAEIRAVVEVGDPDEVLLRQAEKERARLIVVGSVGHRGARWILGSTADRVAARSDVPVLVTRENFPAHEWLQEEKPLRVVVASDLGPSTSPAVEWAAHLPEHAPCAFVLAHVSWPLEEYDHLALDGPMRLDRTHPVVEDLVQRDLATAAGLLRGVGETRTVVETNVGRTADALTLLASRETADLLVVGRGRDEERHWWETSTSRAVVRRASMSVVCVPDSGAQTDVAVPEVRRLLAATDFSRRGNAAVAYALALAPAGGEVLIVHVMETEDEAEEQRRCAALEELIRSADVPRGASVAIEILAGEPAHLIHAAAERFRADVICLGARGRSGLAKVLFGSVSQELLLRSERPVLLVQAMRAATS